MISNLLADERVTALDPTPHNLLSVMFGQFVNHDLEANALANPTPANAIVITAPDDPFCFVSPAIPSSGPTANICGPGSRLLIPFQPTIGTTVNNLFTTVNQGTSFLDLGTVYGSNDTVLQKLRTFVGGKMLTQDYRGVTVPFGLPYQLTQLLPNVATTGLPSTTVSSGLNTVRSEVFSGGDSRASENVALTMFQTLFLREHNRLAVELAGQHSDWNDEQLFQAARARNIASYQNIVLYEYLPSEFGTRFTQAVGNYRGYQPTLDPAVNESFAAAAFRYGHSALRGYTPIDTCGRASTRFPPAGELPLLGQAGGPISPLIATANAGSYENIVRGLVATQSAAIDTRIHDGVRNIVFGAGPFVGLDLVAIDLRRGRVNGVPNYEALQRVYREPNDKAIYGSSGCPAALATADTQNDPLACFLQVTARNNGQTTAEAQELATQLQAVYGKVKRIDAMIGLLAEAKVVNSSFGGTLGNIIAEQYRRARDADRYWFENNQFDAQTLRQIQATRLVDVLRRNFNLAVLPPDVFVTPTNFAQQLAGQCQLGQVP
jgi:hypothetical protein